VGAAACRMAGWHAKAWPAAQAKEPAHLCGSDGGNSGKTAGREVAPTTSNSQAPHKPGAQGPNGGRDGRTRRHQDKVKEGAGGLNIS
jgi:hypothetical protein